VTFDSIENKPRVDSIFGVDVSHYDPATLAFDQFRSQGILFVYAKATQGTTFADPNFRTYWAALGALPQSTWIPRGAYLFLSAGSPGADQADAFVAYVNLAGGFKANDLPPVVDLEWDVETGTADAWVGHSADDILTQVKACLARIQQLTGRTPMLYTATSWFGPNTIPLSRFAEIGAYPVWIADYDPKRLLAESPSLPPGVADTLWQFADNAHTTADPDPIDASIYHGTDASFAAALGPTPPPFP
jgi:lysozyme